MKKLVLLTFLVPTFSFAQTLESHISDSLKPISKALEGKKGTVTLGTFISGNSNDTCPPSKSVNSKVSSRLASLGVKTTLAKRAVNMDSDQAEISRVVKLSGGSYIILGSYELSGTKFKLDCAVYDHNGTSAGACEDVPAATITAEQVATMSCPKKEEPKEKAKEEIKETKESKVTKEDKALEEAPLKEE